MGEAYMETAFQKVKVHNEIAWCEVNELAVKEQLEKVLLKNRVSYCISWGKPKWFQPDKKEKCTFCVSQLQREAAEEAIQALPEEVLSKIVFINKKVDKIYY